MSVTRPLPAIVRLLTLFLALSALPGSALPATPPASGGHAIPSTERDALASFQRNQYDHVIRLFETLPSDQRPSGELLRVALLSYLRLGQAEAALKTYARLVPPGHQDNPRWLRDVALSFITSHARDTTEHVRIAAFTALADLASREENREVRPLLEDGLLDSSPLVRARAVEGLGKFIERDRQSHPSHPAVSSQSLKRALDDSAPAVRIAALSALGDANDFSALDQITRLARGEESAVQVFALAALVKLGRSDALTDLLSAATLPDPDSRMAALGVLGRLKRPASFSLLSQSIYDPDPSVRAFAAGALGEFGDPRALPALTHALSDESPRVRSIAAVSLGRLGLGHTLVLLRQAAQDPVEMVRAGAIEGLLRLSSSTRCPKANNGSSATPCHGAPEEAILLAANLANHPDPSVRSAAAQALGLGGHRKALPVLERLLQDQQPQPRLTAARAMGKLGDRTAAPLLKKALQDTDPAVRVTAAGSLALLLPRKS